MAECDSDGNEGRPKEAAGTEGMPGIPHGHASKNGRQLAAGWLACAVEGTAVEGTAVEGTGEDTMGRPYVLVSCAASVDGYIDDSTDQRLMLSDDADFDRVDQLRADSDAILVGATTLRRDDPRLEVRSTGRRGERIAQGATANPVKVVVTKSGKLSPDLRLWHSGGGKIVYCPDAAVPKAQAALGDLAQVVGLGDGLDFGTLLDDLGGRNVRRLMVEGGTTVITAFLTADLVDELRLAIAPFFVGDSQAPRLVHPGRFPDGPARRMRLVDVHAAGDMAVLTYTADRDG